MCAAWLEIGPRGNWQDELGFRARPSVPSNPNAFPRPSRQRLPWRAYSNAPWKNSSGEGRRPEHENRNGPGRRERIQAVLGSRVGHAGCSISKKQYHVMWFRTTVPTLADGICCGEHHPSLHDPSEWPPEPCAGLLAAECAGRPNFVVGDPRAGAAALDTRQDLFTIQPCTIPQQSLAQRYNRARAVG
jgi:hypothetical protein